MGALTVARTVLGLRHHLSHHALNRGRVAHGLARFVTYQLAWRATGSKTLLDWVGGTRLIVGPGMRGVTGEVYMGVNEFEDVMFCAHFLRADDLFVDCGANVGSYSIMAAHVVGARALAIEPIAETITQLEDHIRLNRVDDLVEIARVGVSDKRGELWFTGNSDALNHVTDTPNASDLKVPVETLDDIVADRKPICLKIDVESHEPAVIAGASRTLGSPSLQAVLVEFDPAHRSEETLAVFHGHGLYPHQYDPMTRNLVRTDKFYWHNTLFVRDAELVAERLRTAPQVKIGSRYI